MFLRFENISEKKLLGIKGMMSFARHQPQQLWQRFMPKRKEIKNLTSNDLLSVEVYPDNFFVNYFPEKEFVKWAAAEVRDFDYVPDGLETLMVPGGLYAVFIHAGSSAEAVNTYNYIFKEWLPSSDCVLGERPHIAVMGEKYKHNDPSSEEEIWIPVVKK